MNRSHSSTAHCKGCFLLLRQFLLKKHHNNKNMEALVNLQNDCCKKEFFFSFSPFSHTQSQVRGCE
jgi:hypothetical protein